MLYVFNNTLHALDTKRCKTMKTSQKRYNMQVITQTLRVLEKNNFVLLKTEKLTGITRQTIKIWASEYGSKVFSGKAPFQEALETIDAELKINDTKIVRMLYGLRMKGLIRLFQTLEYETKSEKIVDTLRYVSEELEKLTNMDAKRSGISYFDIVNQELLDSGYGVKIPEKIIPD